MPTFLSDRLSIPTEREYSDEGFLIVPARISRTGIQEYLAVEMGLTDRDPSEIIRVFRPEEEVFSEKSLKSFENKPVTDNHPPGLLNAKNAKEFTVGHAIGDVKRDGMFVSTTIHVTDAEAIAKIESGKVELSNGYTSDIVWTPGVTPTGESFDAIQRNIKGNHIAIVERGRAGPACRVADNLPITGDIVIMAKITIDGVDYEVSDQAAQAVSKLHQRVSDAGHETQIETEKAKKKEDELEEAKKEAKSSHDSMQAKLDSANEKIPTAETMDKMVVDRTALVDSVRAIVPDIKWEGKDAMTLRKEVVAVKCPTVQMDSVSDDYVQARFDMLREAISINPQQSLTDALTLQVTKPTGTEVKDNRPASVIARDSFAERSRNAWKPKKEAS